MREALYERIAILEQNGVISPKVAACSRQVTDLVLSAKDDVSQDKMEMFVTHFAMAGQRAEDGTEENPMDEVLLESMKLEPAYEEALKLRDQILAETDIQFPKTEQDFLSVHLCSLLS